MDSDTPLDNAIFQLSPRGTRCELFVSGNGKTEMVASELWKPLIITHMNIGEEQAAQKMESIRLEVESGSSVGDDGTWFSKGTIERFVQFVSAPEVLESISALEEDMSQLEGSKRMFSQGAGDPLSRSLSQHQKTSKESADMTRKELFEAIDLRLDEVKEDLSIAFSQASSAGFTPKTVQELLLFAQYFGAVRLNKACTNFISIRGRYPELATLQHPVQSLHLPLKSFDRNVGSSTSSDILVDEPEAVPGVSGKPPDSSSFYVHVPAATGSSTEHTQGGGGGSSSHLSVKDRISLFENKKKEECITSSEVAKKVASPKGHPRRQASDVSDESALTRWSGPSDTRIDIRSSTSRTPESSYSEHQEAQLPKDTTPVSTLGAGVREAMAIEKRRENLGHPEKTLHEQSLVHKHIKKFEGEGLHSERKKVPIFSVMNKKERMDFLDPPSTSSEKQVQISTRLKGEDKEPNQGKKFQADWLEKLIAAPKLSSQKMKLVKEKSKIESEFDANLVSDVASGKEDDSNLMQPSGSATPDDFKGRYYEKYTEKRNKKLQEEWESNRILKEEKLKAMRERLENSLTEMKTKFEGPSSTSSASRSKYSSRRMLAKQNLLVISFVCRNHSFKSM